MLQTLALLATLATPTSLGGISEPPEPQIPDAAPPSEPPDARLETYRRERLAVQALERPQRWATPIPRSPAWDTSRDPLPGFGAGMPVPAPVPADAPDWGIVRGGVDVVDEIDLARLLGDDSLRRGIEDARFWPRLAWSASLGAVAAAGLGTGGWLTFARDYDSAAGRRDGQTVGLSLLTVGATAAVLAWFYPGSHHVLTPQEAAYKCDSYNKALRERLGVHAE
ncbi:MAG TPA: hypothetical protein VFH51_12710 [Myxococcota bacterium]|nr:hypothetical protein [Myxococcota bacterium]